PQYWHRLLRVSRTPRQRACPERAELPRRYCAARFVSCRVTKASAAAVTTMQTRTPGTKSIGAMGVFLRTRFISALWAIGGTHRFHGLSPSWLNRPIIGDSDTAIVSTTLFACASLTVRLRMATAIIRADRAAANGASTAMNQAASTQPKRNIAAS